MTKESKCDNSTLSFKKIKFCHQQDEMTSASKDILLHAIQDLLSKCTGVPTSSLPHLLKPLCPPSFDIDDSILQTTVFELFGSQKLNLETWFIQENLAENYLLSWCMIANEDLVRPSRNFFRQPFPETRHCEIIVYKNIKVSHFYFSIKSETTEQDELEKLLDRMQDVYTHSQDPIFANGDSCPPLLPTLASGVLCAVFNHQQWVRGRITSVEQNTVKVDLVDDCGTLKISLPTSNLRILTDEFRDVFMKKLRASFCAPDLASEEVTNNRVLLAVHCNWKAYRIDRIGEDPVNVRPEHSFLATLRVASNDEMLPLTQTLVFYPVFEEKLDAVN